MVVVQINHLGGALARPAPNCVPYREGQFLVRMLAMSDREKARAILDPAFALLDGPGEPPGCGELCDQPPPARGERAPYPAERSAPVTLGRAVNFAFGAGDRSEGLYDGETRKRLAGLKSQYDPASLFPDHVSGFSG